jgi:hypothetical protein
VPNRDARDLQRDARARFDDVRVIVDETHERAADVAAPEDPDPNPVLHG